MSSQNTYQRTGARKPKRVVQYFDAWDLHPDLKAVGFNVDEHDGSNAVMVGGLLIEQAVARAVQCRRLLEQDFFVTAEIGKVKLPISELTTAEYAYALWLRIHNGEEKAPKDPNVLEGFAEDLAPLIVALLQSHLPAGVQVRVSEKGETKQSGYNIGDSTKEIVVLTIKLIYPDMREKELAKIESTNEGQNTGMEHIRYAYRLKKSEVLGWV